MWLIHLAMAFLFIALGILFARGKGAFLIAGYNTSIKKEEYDEPALLKFMSKVMFSFALCFSLTIFGELIGNMLFLWIGWAIFLAITLFAVIYSNTNDRFKKGA